MQDTLSDLVTNLRAASRDLVRELGFMGRTLAGTELSPSAVHAIIEISEGCLAKDLSERLLLEKSTVSRLVKSLMAKGIVAVTRSRKDGRRKNLTLTAPGMKTAAAIAKFAQSQVTSALDPLNAQRRREILAGIESYAAALKADRLSIRQAPAIRQGAAIRQAPAGKRVIIKRGYRPGVIGGIVHMHATFYSRLAGFGDAFETQVASGLGDFISRLDNSENALWYGEQDGGIVASIVIDGEDLEAGQGHLRWFIVNEGLRGAGVGKSLIQRALAFCDERGFSETHLWTFKGLDAARGLYESHGFSLVEEYQGDQWGAPVTEQKFARPRP